MACKQPRIGQFGRPGNGGFEAGAIIRPTSKFLTDNFCGLCNRGASLLGAAGLGRD
jgi:hypothetical protein